MKRKLIFLLLLSLPCSVFAENAYIVTGGETYESIGKQTGCDVEEKEGNSSSASHTGNDQSSSGGTKVSPEEQNVINGKTGIWDYLQKDVMNKISQKYIGSTATDLTYIGTGSIGDFSNFQKKLKQFDEFLKPNLQAKYNANDFPQKIDSKETLEKNLMDQFQTQINIKDKYTSSSGNNSSGNSSSGNGSSGSDSSGRNPGGNNTITLPPGYGFPSYENGLIDLHNRDQNGISIGNRFKSGNSVSGLAKDVFKDGVSDFLNWDDRHKTLLNYKSTSTSLEDYQDVAYVTDYSITSKNKKYQKIIKFEDDVKWELLDESGNIVQNGNGDQQMANLKFKKPGKYTFRVKQKVNITTGTSVYYIKRRYLVLIPTNTLLFFTEEKMGPIILDKKNQMDYKTIKLKTFTVKDLTKVNMQSDVERVE